MDGWVGGWMDGWINRPTDRLIEEWRDSAREIKVMNNPVIAVAEAPIWQGALLTTDHGSDVIPRDSDCQHV